ncbi:DHA2 family efflux MFS transporter permease subunit [Nocardia sp. ET3-3]|uniref:DHA2 family efflux MFS transporter permease subunit n=1 Tax=Nocardia terrae TaxID=2675851 RepID=A0A7K1V5R7_9NOCA|nr:MFS transporter [Nocardia terrae]MVU81974.1 DHA2 family efflux MFS transporter permease subunit [Nocardia terrae]
MTALHLSSRPESATTPSNPWITLVAVTGGQFLAVLSTTVISVALPTIGRELHADATATEWIVNSYVLVYASLLMLSGGLGDRYGRKGIFLTGMATFALGALIAGLASNIPMLLVGRVIQGIGPALLVPTSLAVVRSAFPNERERAVAIGAWSTSSGLALAVGPILGGVVVTGLGWRWVLLLNVPLVAVFATVAAHIVPRLPRTLAAGRFDWQGAVLTATAVAALSFGLIEGREQGWTSATILGAFALAILAGLVFVGWERRHSDPLVDLALFGNRAFAAANLAGAVAFFAFVGLIVYLSAYFQQVQGHSAIRAGLDVCSVGVAFALATPISGRLVGRCGPRLPMVTGLALGGLAVVGLLSMRSDSGIGSLWWILAVGGFGLGLCLTPMTATALAAVHPHRAGMASSIHNALRQVGQVLGVAVLGALAYSGPVLSMAGLHHAFAVAGGSLLVMAVIAALALRVEAR